MPSFYVASHILVGSPDQLFTLSGQAMKDILRLPRPAMPPVIQVSISPNALFSDNYKQLDNFTMYFSFNV